MFAETYLKDVMKYDLMMVYAVLAKKASSCLDIDVLRTYTRVRNAILRRQKIHVSSAKVDLILMKSNAFLANKLCRSSREIKNWKILKNIILNKRMKMSKKKNPKAN